MLTEMQVWEVSSIFITSGYDVFVSGVATCFFASHVEYTKTFQDIPCTLTIKGESEGQAVPVQAMKSYEEDYGLAPLLTSALEVVSRIHAPTILPPVRIAQGHNPVKMFCGK
jgi:hypothetical protein